MTALLALGLLPAPALAIAPTEDTYIGVEPARLPVYHAATQVRLRQGEGWRRFLDTEGAGWQARFDEATGTPHRAWGPGLDLGPVTTTAEVEAALRSLFARQPDLLEVDDDRLALRTAGHVARTDTWYVDFDRLVGDVPIYRSGVTARIKHGRLILLGIDTHPTADWVSTSPEIGESLAIAEAIAQGPAPDGDHEVEGARLVLLPRDLEGGIHYDLTWEVRSRTAEPIGIWVSYIDAHNAELLSVHNEVWFFDGHIQAIHDLRTVDGNTTTSDVPLVTVSNGPESTFTDVSGRYSLEPADDGTVQTLFEGDYVEVRNQAGDELEVVFEGPDYTWQVSGDHAMAQVDSYVFLHHVREWGLATAPEVRMSTTSLRSNVNLNSSCNAYYDGNVNFYTAGDGCNNTGRIADVNYHEWGHGFHYYSLEAGSFDGAMSEGIGDIIAAFLTDDPIVAPYFMTSGSGIREMDSDRRYPEDWVNEVHYDGLIFAGAVWDLWDVLTRELDSREDARVLTARLMADGIKGGPSIPDVYDEFLVADDDDGDLGNGTPNQCAILEAFQLHGLGPGGNQSLTTVLHPTVDNHLPDQEIWVDAELVNLAPECNDFQIAGGAIHYTTDDGLSWQEAEMSVDSATSLTGSIPPQPEGTIVQYYVEIDDADGDVQSEPSGGTINPHSFYVGELVELYCTDFEDAFGGDFRHELVSGEDELGADDWQLGTPAGTAGDPDQAYSGDQVWGNDLGYGNYNGEYQHGKHNRLYSPAIDVSDAQGGPLLLQFRRWLTVEDGYYDQAFVTVDGEEVWENHATVSDIGDEHHLDAAWSLATYAVSDADGDGTIEVGWDLSSDQRLAFGGWNLDDVCVYSIGEPAGDPDPDPEGSEDGDELDGEDPWDVSAGGCGCTSSSAPVGAAPWLLLAGLALAARRRRT